MSRVYFRITIPEGFKMVFWRFCFGLFLVLAVVSGVPVEAKADETIQAEKVDPSSLKEGDQFLIVYGDYLALSKNPYNTKYVAPVALSVRSTATRQVLTEIPGEAAIFTLSVDGSGFYLRCDKGYLTSAATGNGLNYTNDKTDYGIWEFSEGKFLHNLNAAYTTSSYTYKNYHVEFYNSYFTTYGKNKNSQDVPFTLGFYRLGNSNEDEPILDDSYYKLPLFQTSDTHGYLADTGTDDVKYRLAYISDKVKDVRGYDCENEKLAILLDGGDIYQGNVQSNLLSGNSISAAYQMMGYDAVTIGNHDFDWGIEAFADADKTMKDYDLGDGYYYGENKIPLVVSNLYKNTEKVSFADDYIILEKTARNKDGQELNVRIGVIGFAGDYSDSIMKSKFTDQGYRIDVNYNAVNDLAYTLEEQEKCDATILLTHNEATETANGLGDSSVIDLVLGGHTHVNIMGKTKSGITYMEPMSYGQAYCYADITFEKNGDDAIFKAIMNPRTVTTTISSDRMTKNEANKDELDPEIVELTDAVLSGVDSVMKEEIGYITESAYRYQYIAGSGERACTCGNWMSSIIKRIGKADVGFVNGHGMRMDVLVEDGADRRIITLSDIYTMFPFDNRVYCYSITYGELISVLQYALNDKGSELLTHMTGIDCYFSGDTINALVTEDGQLIYENGIWTNGWEDKKLRVAISEFLATTDRSDGSLHNPFVAWNDTDKLVDTDLIDNVGSRAVLSAEALENDGKLMIDKAPHFISGVYQAKSRISVLPQPKTLTYNDTPQELVTAGEAIGGTMQYALGTDAGTSPDASLYTTSIPTGTNEGTYYVWYKVVANGNYIDTDPDCVTVKIAQYIPPHYHSYTSTVTKEPTCTEDGERTYSCSCGNSYKETIKATGHTLVAHEAKDATCGEDGNKAYWECSKCKKFFSDAEGKNEISEEDTKISKYIDITKATVTGLAVKAYTGKAIAPVVTVKYDGKTLKKSTDYKVTYANNTNVGTATVTITGTGDYAGTITKKFLIKQISFKYRAYVQKKNWMSWSTAKVSGTEASKMAGTTDNLRMETIQMQLSGVGGSIEYRAYCAKKGWTQWATTADTTTYAGTKGESRRVELIQIRAKGQVANLYDMYYRTYCEKFGWLNWAKNGEKAGTQGYAYKLEAFQVNFVRMDETFKLADQNKMIKSFYDKTKDGANPK